MLDLERKRASFSPQDLEGIVNRRSKFIEKVSIPVPTVLPHQGVSRLFGSRNDGACVLLIAPTNMPLGCLHVPATRDRQTTAVPTTPLLHHCKAEAEAGWLKQNREVQSVTPCR